MMTEPIPGSIHALQCASNNLKFYEQFLHNQLMGTAPKLWPESLAAYVQKKIDQYGLCGDVVSIAVADWIRYPREG